MTARELVAKVKDLPVASPAATCLIGLLGDPSASNDDIVQVLKCESVLTAKLLRLCNGSSLALKGRVSSVDQAVMLLGHEEILRLVLALSLNQPLSVPIPGYAV